MNIIRELNIYFANVRLDLINVNSYSVQLIQTTVEHHISNFYSLSRVFFYYMCISIYHKYPAVVQSVKIPHAIITL